MKNSLVVYPGTFDPVTNGHLDLIERSIQLFGHLVVAVVANPSKQAYFSLDERLEMLHEATQGIDGVEIDSFDNLLIDYMVGKNAQVILRGLRAISDFEYELELALTNRRMASQVETMFMTPSVDYIYLRASLVKEIAKYGGDVSPFVPAEVQRRLTERFRRSQESG